MLINTPPPETIPDRMPGMGAGTGDTWTFVDGYLYVGDYETLAKPPTRTLLELWAEIATMSTPEP